MRRVVAISNPLRAAQCRLFIEGDTADQVVVTRNSRPFADMALDNLTSLVVLGATEGPRTLTGNTRSRIYGRLVSTPGAQSGLSRWLDRVFNRLAWRMRYFDRLMMVRSARRRPQLESREASRSTLFTELEAQRRQGVIDQIVVFDLFDLPIATEFARRHDVEVLIR